MNEAVSFARWPRASGASARRPMPSGAIAGGAGARISRPGQHEPQRLGTDEEDRVVVRRDRERGHDPPGGGAAGPRLLERAQPQQRRERGERDEQRVRAGLLAEPHEQRVDGDDRRRHEPRALAADPASERPHDRDRRRPDERRQRPQTDLAGAEDLRPEPAQHVVQRRRRLAIGDRVEHPREVHPHELRGDRLVVPQALRVERREAQHRAGNADERQRGWDAAGHARHGTS